MALRCDNTTKLHPWGFDLSFKSTSNHVLKRLPFTNLSNRASLNDRYPVNLLKSRKKTEALANQEIEPLKKHAKEVPFHENGQIVEYDEKEGKLVVEPFYDQKVQSNFTQEDANFYINPELLDSIYVHMKEKERANGLLQPRSSSKISKELRSSIVDQLICASGKFQLDTETFQLSVHYFDKFLSREEIEVADLPLVKLCAVVLACKFEEASDTTPEINDLMGHFTGEFSNKDALSMERRILKTLCFDMSHPTPYHFLRIFCSLCHVKRDERLLAQCICDIALIYEDICFNVLPSQIAVASIFLSNCLRGVKRLLPELSVFSNYEAIYIKFVANLLLSKYNKILYSEFDALKIKYGASEYKNVLYTVSPSDLII